MKENSKTEIKTAEKKKVNKLAIIAFSLAFVLLACLAVTFFHSDFYDTILRKTGINGGGIDSTIMLSWKRSLSKSQFDSVFLGDSITSQGKWEDEFGAKTCVLAVPGTTVEGCAQMAEAIPQMSAKKVFVMVGVNNLGNWNYLKTIEKDYQRLIDALKDSDIKLYIESILPVCASSKVDNAKVKEANQLIKKIAEENDCVYVDIYDSFLDENNEYMDSGLSKDGIHLNDKGYKKLYSLLKPYTE